MSQPVALQRTDAVLGGYHAASLSHEVVGNAIHGMHVGVGIARDLHHDVQVAVADVAEEEATRSGLRNRDRGAASPDIIVHDGNREADVEIDDVVDMRLRQRPLANVPEPACIGVRLRDEGVEDDPLFDRFLEQGFQPAAFRLDNHRERRRLGEKAPSAAQFEIVRPHQFKGGKRHVPARQAHQRKHGIVACERADRRLDVGRQRAQAQHGTGDDRERAFRSRQQMPEVVARVVLAHARQMRQHRSVCLDSLQTEQVIAHRSVPDHAQPTGVGRDVASDLARSPCTEIDRQQEAGVPGSILRHFKHRAGAHNHGAGDRIDFLDTLETRQRKCHVARTAIRAARKPGHATLRHHRLTVAMADFERLRYLRNRSWPQQSERQIATRGAGVRAMGDAFESPARQACIGIKRGAQFGEDVHRRQLSIPVRWPSTA